MPSTKRRHASWMSAGVSCSASRRTTSAALTSALSVRSGCDACPGVPRTVMVHQNAPFSPVMTGRRTPSGLPIGKPAGLGDEVVAAHVVGEVLGQPLGAMAAEGLLVGHADEQEVALGAESLVGQVAHRHGHRRREVEHVHRPPTPHLAVDDLAAEGVVAPVLAVGGDDIGVPEERQGGGVRVAALELGHQGGAPGEGLVQLHVEPSPLEQVAEEIGVALLVARLGCAVVDAGVADHRLEEFGYLATHDLRPWPASYGERPARGGAGRRGSDRSRRRDG